MSYEKQTWQTGDTITAEKLNNIEQGVANWSSIGYECKEEIITIFDDSVTTAKIEESDLYAIATLTYSATIEADTIKVTFDGEEYICENISDLEGRYEYGAPWNTETQFFDWSEYPFSIVSTYYDDSVMNSLASTEAGTYQIKIETFGSSITTTPCFDEAVKKVINEEEPLVVVLEYTEDETHGNNFVVKKFDADAIKSFAKKFSPRISGVTYYTTGDTKCILSLQNLVVNEYYATCELQFVGYIFTHNGVNGQEVLSNVTMNLLEATLNTNDGSVIGYRMFDKQLS